MKMKLNTNLFEEGFDVFLLKRKSYEFSKYVWSSTMDSYWTISLTKVFNNFNKFSDYQLGHKQPTH